MKCFGVTMVAKECEIYSNKVVSKAVVVNEMARKRTP